MEHEFTTSEENQGVWQTPAHTEFCRWWWDERTRTLRVQRGSTTQELNVPRMDQRVGCGMELDLAETAKDVALQIGRFEASRVGALPAGRYK